MLLGLLGRCSGDWGVAGISRVVVRLLGRCCRFSEIVGTLLLIF